MKSAKATMFDDSGVEFVYAYCPNCQSVGRDVKNVLRENCIVYTCSFCRMTFTVSPKKLEFFGLTKIN